MKKKKLNPPGDHGEEIVSLNQKLFSEFKIEELEERYETDPLMLTHLFNLAGDGDNELARGCACKKIGSCPELQCGCKGEFSDPPFCPELGCSPIVSVG